MNTVAVAAEDLAYEERNEEQVFEEQLGKLREQEAELLYLQEQLASLKDLKQKMMTAYTYDLSDETIPEINQTREHDPSEIIETRNLSEIIETDIEKHIADKNRFQEIPSPVPELLDRLDAASAPSELESSELLTIRADFEQTRSKVLAAMQVCFD
jgi:hypothetical protein